MALTSVPITAAETPSPFIYVGEDEQLGSRMSAWRVLYQEHSAALLYSGDLWSSAARVLFVNYSLRPANDHIAGIFGVGSFNMFVLPSVVLRSVQQALMWPLLGTMKAPARLRGFVGSVPEREDPLSVAEGADEMRRMGAASQPSNVIHFRFPASRVDR